MPTPSGLPKPGDQLYNNYFKQRFVVAGRSSNSYPLSVDVQPHGGRDLPREMQVSGKINPNGTYRLLLEAPPDDLFRMGLSQWTFLPDQGSIEPGRRILCNRDGAHSAHLYLRRSIWHYCPGVKSPEPAPAETNAAPLTGDNAYAVWYRREFGTDPVESETGSAFYSAFMAGRRYEQETK